MAFRGHMAVLLGALTILVVFHLMTGSVALSLAEVADGVRGEGRGALIVRAIRVPRILTAIGAGAGLAISGLLMQTFFLNPLAGPSVLGVTTGASMGVALAVLGGHAVGAAMGLPVLAVAACLGGAAVLAVIFFVAMRHGGTVRLLVFGLMLSYAVGALVTVLQAEAAKTALQAFVFWGMGTFGNGTVGNGVMLLGAVGLAGVLALRRSRDLNAWTLGPLTAASMGVSARGFRVWVLAVTGVLAGLVTALCGPVAFLGLAAPHWVRWVHAGRNHGELIPLTGMWGAVLALAADAVVRAPWGGVPLNAVLSLMGAPMVLHVLMKKTWSA